MTTQEAFAHFDPQSLNNWCPEGYRYTVEVREPKSGEWYIAGRKVVCARSDGGFAQPVIVAVHPA